MIWFAAASHAKPVPDWVGNPNTGRDPAVMVCADGRSELPDPDLARTEAELFARARVAEQVSATLARRTGRDATGALTDDVRAETDQVLTGLRYEATHFDPSPTRPKRVFVLACVALAPARPAAAVVAMDPRLPDLQAELRVGGHGANDAALVVGIESYFVLPPVPHALRDAEAFYDVLVYTVGVPADHVVKLTGTPSREQLEQGLAAAAAAAGPGGTLWVYFAGHGAADPVDGARLLLGADVQPDVASLGARGLPLATVAAHPTAAAHTLVVADTCYTGAGRDGAALVPGKRFAVPAYAMPPSPTTTVWTATGANELSGPYDPAAQGLFTYFVVGALRGWSDGGLDGKRDGAVTLAEAQAYVAQAVGAVSNQAQHPTATGGATDWVLTGGAGLETGPELAGLPRVP
jgi:hypothetical protein